MLSTAEVVNTPVLSFDGHTVPRFSKCWLMAEFPRSPDTASTRSYETNNPSLKSVYTRSFDFVLEWTKAPTKSGSGVSPCSVCWLLAEGKKERKSSVLLPSSLTNCCQYPRIFFFPSTRIRMLFVFSVL